MMLLGGPILLLIGSIISIIVFLIFLVVTFVITQFTGVFGLVFFWVGLGTLMLVIFIATVIFLTVSGIMYLVVGGASFMITGLIGLMLSIPTALALLFLFYY